MGFFVIFGWIMDEFLGPIHASNDVQNAFIGCFEAYSIFLWFLMVKDFRKFWNFEIEGPLPPCVKFVKFAI